MQIQPTLGLYQPIPPPPPPISTLGPLFLQILDPALKIPLQTPTFPTNLTTISWFIPPYSTHHSVLSSRSHCTVRLMKIDSQFFNAIHEFLGQFTSRYLYYFSKKSVGSFEIEHKITLHFGLGCSRKWTYKACWLILPWSFYLINACVKGNLEPTHLKSSPLFTLSTKSLGQDSPSIHLFSKIIGSRFTTAKIKLGEDSPSWFVFSRSRFAFKQRK